ncbi:MAG TPA: response regulator [Acidimicrobiales bacterium]|nr:response regulator [Acidimicrobiales bacterium]
MTRVLVVDDNPVARCVAVMALELAGMDVDEAPDGSLALERLAAEPADAVVLDIMMPGLSGHDVLAERRRRHLAPETAVIMLTCKTDDADITRAFAAGACDYMTKPFDPDALVRAVRTAVYGSIG